MAWFEAFKKELENHAETEKMEMEDNKNILQDQLSRIDQKGIMNVDDNKSVLHDQLLRTEKKAAGLWNLDALCTDKYTRIVTRRKAKELFRAFQNATRSERRSPAFIDNARYQLESLRLYNNGVLLHKKRYPRTKWMFYLLCRYVALEYEALGPNPDPNKCEAENLVFNLETILSKYFDVDSKIRCKVFIVNIIVTAYHSYKIPEWYMETLAGLALKGTIIPKQLDEIYSGEDDLLCVSNMWFNEELKYFTEMDGFGTDDEDSDTSEQEDSKDFQESMHRKNRRKDGKFNNRNRLKSGVLATQGEDDDDVILMKDEKITSDCDSMKEFDENSSSHDGSAKQGKGKGNANQKNDTKKKSGYSNSSGNQRKSKSSRRSCRVIIIDDDDEVSQGDIKSECVDSDVEVIDGAELPIQIRTGKVKNKTRDRKKKRTKLSSSGNFSNIKKIPKPICVDGEDEDITVSIDNSTSTLMNSKQQNTSIAHTSPLINSLEISTTSSNLGEHSKGLIEDSSKNQHQKSDAPLDQISSTVVNHRKRKTDLDKIKDEEESEIKEEPIVTSTKPKGSFSIDENDDFLKQLQELASSSDANSDILQKNSSRIFIPMTSNPTSASTTKVTDNKLTSTSLIIGNCNSETISTKAAVLGEISSTALEITHDILQSTTSQLPEVLTLSVKVNVSTETLLKKSMSLEKVSSTAVVKQCQVDSTLLRSSQFPEVSSTENISSHGQKNIPAVQMDLVDSQIGQSNIEMEVIEDCNESEEVIMAEKFKDTIPVISSSKKNECLKMSEVNAGKHISSIKTSRVEDKICQTDAQFAYFSESIFSRSTNINDKMEFINSIEEKFEKSENQIPATLLEVSEENPERKKLIEGVKKSLIMPYDLQVSKNNSVKMLGCDETSQQINNINNDNLNRIHMEELNKEQTEVQSFNKQEKDVSVAQNEAHDGNIEEVTKENPEKVAEKNIGEENTEVTSFNTNKSEKCINLQQEVPKENTSLNEIDGKYVGTLTGEMPEENNKVTNSREDAVKQSYKLFSKAVTNLDTDFTENSAKVKYCEELKIPVKISSQEISKENTEELRCVNTEKIEKYLLTHEEVAKENKEVPSFNEVEMEKYIIPQQSKDSNLTTGVINFKEDEEKSENTFCEAETNSNNCIIEKSAKIPHLQVLKENYEVTTFNEEEFEKVKIPQDVPTQKKEETHSNKNDIEKSVELLHENVFINNPVEIQNGAVTNSEIKNSVEVIRKEISKEKINSNNIEIKNSVIPHEDVICINNISSKLIEQVVDSNKEEIEKYSKNTHSEISNYVTTHEEVFRENTEELIHFNKHKIFEITHEGPNKNMEELTNSDKCVMDTCFLLESEEIPQKQLNDEICVKVSNEIKESAELVAEKPSDSKIELEETVNPQTIKVVDGISMQTIEVSKCQEANLQESYNVSSKILYKPYEINDSTVVKCLPDEKSKPHSESHNCENNKLLTVVPVQNTKHKTEAAVISSTSLLEDNSKEIDTIATYQHRENISNQITPTENSNIELIVIKNNISNQECTKNDIGKLIQAKGEEYEQLEAPTSHEHKDGTAQISLDQESKHIQSISENLVDVNQIQGSFQYPNSFGTNISQAVHHESPPETITQSVVFENNEIINNKLNIIENIEQKITHTANSDIDHLEVITRINLNDTESDTTDDCSFNETCPDTDANSEKYKAKILNVVDTNNIELKNKIYKQRKHTETQYDDMLILACEEQTQPGAEKLGESIDEQLQDQCLEESSTTEKTLNETSMLDKQFKSIDSINLECVYKMDERLKYKKTQYLHVSTSELQVQPGVPILEEFLDKQVQDCMEETSATEKALDILSAQGLLSKATDSINTEYKDKIDERLKYEKTHDINGSTSISDSKVLQPEVPEESLYERIQVPVASKKQHSTSRKALNEISTQVLIEKELNSNDLTNTECDYKLHQQFKSQIQPGAAIPEQSLDKQIHDSVGCIYTSEITLNQVSVPVDKELKYMNSINTNLKFKENEYMGVSSIEPGGAMLEECSGEQIQDQPTQSCIQETSISEKTLTELNILIENKLKCVDSVNMEFENKINEGFNYEKNKTLDESILTLEQVQTRAAMSEESLDKPIQGRVDFMDEKSEKTFHDLSGQEREGKNEETFKSSLENHDGCLLDMEEKIGNEEQSKYSCVPETIISNEEETCIIKLIEGEKEKKEGKIPHEKYQPSIMDAEKHNKQLMFYNVDDKITDRDDKKIVTSETMAISENGMNVVEEILSDTEIVGHGDHLKLEENCLESLSVENNSKCQNESVDLFDDSEIIPTQVIEESSLINQNESLENIISVNRNNDYLDKSVDMFDTSTESQLNEQPLFINETMISNSQPISSSSPKNQLLENIDKIKENIDNDHSHVNDNILGSEKIESKQKPLKLDVETLQSSNILLSSNVEKFSKQVVIEEPIPGESNEMRVEISNTAECMIASSDTIKNQPIEIPDKSILSTPKRNVAREARRISEITPIREKVADENEEIVQNLSNKVLIQISPEYQDNDNKKIKHSPSKRSKSNKQISNLATKVVTNVIDISEHEKAEEKNVLTEQIEKEADVQSLAVGIVRAITNEKESNTITHSVSPDKNNTEETNFVNNSTGADIVSNAIEESLLLKNRDVEIIHPENQSESEHPLVLNKTLGNVVCDEEERIIKVQNKLDGVLEQNQDEIFPYDSENFDIGKIPLPIGPQQLCNHKEMSWQPPASNTIQESHCNLESVKAKELEPTLKIGATKRKKNKTESNHDYKRMTRSCSKSQNKTSKGDKKDPEQNENLKPIQTSEIHLKKIDNYIEKDANGIVDIDISNSFANALHNIDVQHPEKIVKSRFNRNKVSTVRDKKSMEKKKGKVEAAVNQGCYEIVEESVEFKGKAMDFSLKSKRKATNIQKDEVIPTKRMCQTGIPAELVPSLSGLDHPQNIPKHADDKKHTNYHMDYILGNIKVDKISNKIDISTKAQLSGIDNRNNSSLPLNNTLEMSTKGQDTSDATMNLGENLDTSKLKNKSLTSSENAITKYGFMSSKNNMKSPKKRWEMLNKTEMDAQRIISAEGLPATLKDLPKDIHQENILSTPKRNVSREARRISEITPIGENQHFVQNLTKNCLLEISTECQVKKNELFSSEPSKWNQETNNSESLVRTNNSEYDKNEKSEEEKAISLNNQISAEGVGNCLPLIKSDLRDANCKENMQDVQENEYNLDSFSNLNYEIQSTTEKCILSSIEKNIIKLPEENLGAAEIDAKIQSGITTTENVTITSNELVSETPTLLEVMTDTSIVGNEILSDKTLEQSHYSENENILELQNKTDISSLALKDRERCNELLPLNAILLKSVEEQDNEIKDKSTHYFDSKVLIMDTKSSERPSQLMDVIVEPDYQQNIEESKIIDGNESNISKLIKINPENQSLTTQNFENMEIDSVLKSKQNNFLNIVTDIDNNSKIILANSSKDIADIAMKLPESTSDEKSKSSIQIAEIGDKSVTQIDDDVMSLSIKSKIEEIDKHTVPRKCSTSELKTNIVCTSNKNKESGKISRSSRSRTIIKEADSNTKININSITNYLTPEMAKEPSKLPCSSKIQNDSKKFKSNCLPKTDAPTDKFKNRKSSRSSRHRDISENINNGLSDEHRETQCDFLTEKSSKSSSDKHKRTSSKTREDIPTYNVSEKSKDEKKKTSSKSSKPRDIPDKKADDKNRSSHSKDRDKSKSNRTRHEQSKSVNIENPKPNDNTENTANKILKEYSNGSIFKDQDKCKNIHFDKEDKVHNFVDHKVELRIMEEVTTNKRKRIEDSDDRKDHNTDKKVRMINSLQTTEEHMLILGEEVTNETKTEKLETCLYKSKNVSTVKEEMDNECNFKDGREEGKANNEVCEVENKSSEDADFVLNTPEKKCNFDELNNAKDNNILVGDNENISNTCYGNVKQNNLQNYDKSIAPDEKNNISGNDDVANICNSVRNCKDVEKNVINNLKDLVQDEEKPTDILEINVKEKIDESKLAPKLHSDISKATAQTGEQEVILNNTHISITKTTVNDETAFTISKTIEYLKHLHSESLAGKESNVGISSTSIVKDLDSQSCTTTGVSHDHLNEQENFQHGNISSLEAGTDEQMMKCKMLPVSTNPNNIIENKANISKKRKRSVDFVDKKIITGLENVQAKPTIIDLEESITVFNSKPIVSETIMEINNPSNKIIIPETNESKLSFLSQGGNISIEQMINNVYPNNSQEKSSIVENVVAEDLRLCKPKVKDQNSFIVEGLHVKKECMKYDTDSKVLKEKKKIVKRERPKTFEEIISSLRDSDKISDSAKLIMKSTNVEIDKQRGENKAKGELENLKKSNVIVEHVPQLYQEGYKLNPRIPQLNVINNRETTTEKVIQPVIPTSSKVDLLKSKVLSGDEFSVIPSSDSIDGDVLLQNTTGLNLVNNIIAKQGDTSSIGSYVETCAPDLNVSKESDTKPVDLDETPLSEKLRVHGSWVTNALPGTQSAVDDPFFLSVTIKKKDIKLEGIHPGLEYSVDENDIFTFSEQICMMGNNLSNSPPVDITSDYPFSEPDSSFLFIENNLTEGVYNTNENLFIPNIVKEELIQNEEDVVNDFSEEQLSNVFINPNDNQTQEEFNRPLDITTNELFDSSLPIVGASQSQLNLCPVETKGMELTSHGLMNIQIKTKEHSFPLAKLDMADMEVVNYNEAPENWSRERTLKNVESFTSDTIYKTFHNKAESTFNENILQTPRIIPAALENVVIPDLNQKETEVTEIAKKQVQEATTPTKSTNKKQSKSPHNKTNRVNLVSIQNTKPETNNRNKFPIRTSSSTKVCAPKRKSPESQKLDNQESPIKDASVEKKEIARIYDKTGKEDFVAKPVPTVEDLSERFDAVKNMDVNTLPILTSFTAPGNIQDVKNTSNVRKPNALVKVKKSKNTKKLKFYDESDDEDFNADRKKPIETPEQLSDRFDAVKNMDVNTLPILISVEAPGNSENILFKNSCNLRMSRAFMNEPPIKKNKSSITEPKIDHFVKDVKRKAWQKKNSIVPDEEVMWQPANSKAPTSNVIGSRRVSQRDKRNLRSEQDRNMGTRSQYNSSRHLNQANSSVQMDNKHRQYSVNSSKNKVQNSGY